MRTQSKLNGLLAPPTLRFFHFYFFQPFFYETSVSTSRRDPHNSRWSVFPPPSYCAFKSTFFNLPGIYSFVPHSRTTLFRSPSVDYYRHLLLLNRNKGYLPPPVVCVSSPRSFSGLCAAFPNYSVVSVCAENTRSHTDGVYYECPPLPTSFFSSSSSFFYLPPPPPCPS